MFVGYMMLEDVGQGDILQQGLLACFRTTSYPPLSKQSRAMTSSSMNSSRHGTKKHISLSSVQYAIIETSNH